METMKRLSALLPEEIVQATGPLPEDLTELRLRAGRPVQMVRLSGEALVGESIGAATVARAAQMLAGHSLYAREEELKEGYFTIEGGCRVGVCGRMTVRDGQCVMLTHVGSVCVRVARAMEGAADGVMDALFEAGRPLNALIISPPGLGKTTLLRDIARQMSDGTGGRRGVRVSIADERGELAGCSMGVPTLNVGCRTDVMDGCPKRIGMRLLLRAMSPEVIVTDELGHEGDREAVMEAARSGVRVIASVHARNEIEAQARLGTLDINVFDRMIVLGGAVGRIERIGRGDG